MYGFQDVREESSIETHRAKLEITRELVRVHPE
eukprot:CAMPEP_0114544078 /NCGR_PEP_ID=MMETSP0114-20121206/2688_1 /TAXON_ID=31324 /ORGANISM="Goniomonas sp, Strain m" /LENGTH=32 /DNA_ID= /DNA_START= /DNA_END= /DNA_ORIENTATION=